MVDDNVVGKRIAYLRDKVGLSQVDLAKKLNVSPSTVAMWELGEREIKASTLIRIADFFNVSIDFLAGREHMIPETEDIDRLLQKKISDPDDYFFLDGYLEASEEEKKELRRHFYEIKKQMLENNIKPSEPMSLREFNERIKKPDK
jgi:transcriptional regulator with XRE-family HTH domain